MQQQALMQITQDDFGFSWDFILTDAQNNVVDLTSATALFFACQLLSDPTVNFRNAMAIVTANAGTCKYTVNQNDFIVSGTYSANIQVEYGAGETISFAGVTINVLPIIPQA